MGGWAVTNMGGEIPLKDERLLPDNQATAAWNVDLNSGRLEGLPTLELVQDMTLVPGLVNKAYRFPGPTVGVDPDYWLPLRSTFASVVRSPLANDTLHRIYWTESDGTGAFWNTYARFVAGLPNYTLGFLPVESYWIPTVVTADGTIPMEIPNSVAVSAPGAGYTPGTVVMASGGALGVGQGVTQVLITQTQVASIVIAQGGSGGTDGQALIYGTTGQGRRWSGTGTILGGVLTAVTLTDPGEYNQNPVLGDDPIAVNTSTYPQGPAVTTSTPTPAYLANLAGIVLEAPTYLGVPITTLAQAEAAYPAVSSQLITTTTPGSLVGPGVGLTGAAVSVTMGILDVSLQFAGAYLTAPTNPVPVTNYPGGSGSGGSVTLTTAISTDVPEVERSYIFTYVDEYGEESSPSVPSAVVAGASDGTWTVFGLSNVAPTAPAGTVYPTVVKIRIYRTITGATTGGNFYQVAEVALPFAANPSVGWVDTTPDSAITGNNTLQTASWAPPVAGLDGLTTLPGGMLVGFTGNTLHFCEPDYPHTWPASYDISAQYQIVGLGVWQSNLVVLTAGYPLTGSGTAPASYILTQVQVAEPCIARGSILTDLLGVYYASPNGLVMLNYYGMSNQTQAMITRNQWITEYNAKGLIACRHRSQYLALNGLGTGILIDFAEGRRGVVELNTFDNADCMWNDVYAGDVYVLANKMVYRWDSPNTGPMIWRWRSKRWSGTEPLSLGACQITLTSAVTNPPTYPPYVNIGPGVISDSVSVPVVTTPVVPTIVLPAGVNATFQLWANDLYSVITRNLLEEIEIFRLPSGFKSFDWQFELISCVPILKVELASTMEELKKL